MKPILVRAAPLAALIAAASLSGCVAPPSTTVLSRLPEQAAGTTTHTLTPDERKRYDEIDRQALREQNAAIAAEDAARLVVLLSAARHLLRRLLWRRLGARLGLGIRLRLPGLVVVKSTNAEQLKASRK